MAKKGGDGSNQHKRKANNNNVIISKQKQGNLKSYTLDRLKRTDPEMFTDEIAGKHGGHGSNQYKKKKSAENDNIIFGKIEQGTSKVARLTMSVLPKSNEAKE